MSYFTYVDCIYLDDNDDIPKHYHKSFIKKHDPVITITSPMIVLEERLKTLPKHFFENMLVP